MINNSYYYCYFGLPNVIRLLLVLLQAFSSEMTGAMTITFVQATREAFRKNKKISYREIMNYMHETLKQAHKSGRFSGIFRIFHRRILQVLFIF